MVSDTAQIFLDIKNRLEDPAPYFKYPDSMNVTKTGKFVYMWNDSVNRLRKGKWAGVTPMLVFIELLTIDVGQYSNGVREFPMTLRMHILDKFFNSTDDLVNFDQDLRIFEFKDWVFKMLEMFKPTKCGVMTLSREEPPRQHDMIVEYIQEYKFIYVNSLVDQPIDSIEMLDTTTLDDTIIIDKTTNP